MPQVSLTQLNNLKSRLRRNNNSKSTSFNKILAWCQQHAQIPDDLDEVFCGGFQYNLGHKDKLEDLNIFLTTPRLISQISHNSKYFLIYFFIFSHLFDNYY